MKVVAFNGSPRVNGNTAQGLKIVLAELSKEGIETEIIQLGGRKVFGCLACGKCRETKDNRCARKDDEMNSFIQKMEEADGIIIGSPTYFSNVSTEVKALIDRCGYVAKSNGGSFLKGKVGASVVAARRAGSTFTYSAINFFFGIAEMIICSSNYWNLTLSRDPGDVQNDAEGIQTFQTLGNNMAKLLKQVR
ncbi:flavodoxin family protein [Desulfosporosinus sp.]|uniref:flavodoxin family protein n=1 Tax=Desulfosporosinus sp. TaxID=157907 RepID=UPI000E9AB683|nr:flavodoxin family protein [Desulfosporosinus sp.]MBC2724584.1 flavodoxin family protein [Desulfosporosinus sp.]MBC2725185.1 flavodoxin family protein [Desulfosporosinus sp.]HBV87245.1 flavodoxin family protein [Desulfosporosinus sp.]